MTTVTLVRTMVIALLSGCIFGSTPRPTTLKEQDYPGELRSSETLPDGWSYRQRVRARYGEDEGSFSAVVETDSGRLRMLGFTPFGTRGFLLEQVGKQVEFTSYVDRDMPFPPRFALLDLHRAFFLGSAEPPLQQGERVFTQDAEEVRERFKNGRLVSRHYRRLDGKPSGSIDIEYRGGMLGTTPPEVVVLRNGWFGYTLMVTTLRQN